MSIHPTTIVAKDGAGNPIAAGVRWHDTSGTGAGPYQPLLILNDTAGAEVLGTTVDPKNSATDSTAVGMIALLKQISASVQAVVSKGFTSKVSVPRPANTTPYGANTVVGAASAPITFANLAAVAGDVMINSVELELDIAAIPSGMTSFRLYLYSVTPPSALADGAAFDLPSGDRPSFLGFVDLGSPVDLGSTLYVAISNLRQQIKLAGTSVFGYLVTNGGFTPASAAVAAVTLHTTVL